MLTIADRWRLSLPDSWLVPLDLPWDWNPCLRPCQSSSTPSPPNQSLTNWLAALPSPLSPSSNYKKMNLTLFWDLYLAQSDFPAGDRGPADASDCRCKTSGARHLIIFCFHCLSVCFCLFICLCVCLCLCCHCCQILSIYLVNFTNEFRWTSLSFGSCVLATMLAYSSSQQVSFVIIIKMVMIIVIVIPLCGSGTYLWCFRDHPHNVGDILLSGTHLWDAWGTRGAQWLLKVAFLFSL